MNRRPIFQAVRQLRNGQGFTLDEVRLLDDAIDEALEDEAAPVPAKEREPRRVSPKGIALIHSFESCRLETYKDPGSKDGLPITGGWGSTLDENGKPFRLGFRALQPYWDKLFAAQIQTYAAKVDEYLGDAETTQDEFDAMVSLAYNIGTGRPGDPKRRGFLYSSVLRHHKAGNKKDAARAFLLWNKNDGKVMRGLTRRRLAESELYLSRA